MEKWTQEELEELYAKITEKVKKDREFRKELKARPKEVIEKLAGRELPEGFNVQLIEKRGNAEKEFGVPDFSGSEMDLSELKKVSGGAGEDEGPAAETGTRKERRHGRPRYRHRGAARGAAQDLFNGLGRGTRQPPL